MCLSARPGEVIKITGECIYETSSSPWHDRIISLHVKQSPHKFVDKKILFPQAKLFKEKSPPYFGGEEMLRFIFTSFPISKSFIPNFYDANYDLSTKTAEPLCFLKSYNMVKTIFQNVLGLNCKII